MKSNNLSNVNEKYRGVITFTPEELVYYIKKGYNASELAKVFKTTTNIINQALIDYEIDPPHVDTKEVIDLYQSGMPTAVIADKLKITPLAVFYKIVKGKKFVRKK